jgi:putative tryptophan/tyrosine transport system substrate-binding protein
MQRRAFLWFLGTVLAESALAQKLGARTIRMGFLSNYSEAAGRPLVNCFIRALAQLGWIEGQNLAVEYRWAEGKSENHQRYAFELVALNLDIIAVNSTQAAKAMREATTPNGVPVVFMSVSDPVESGIVQSIPRPGANITGLSNFFPANSAKLLETIRMITPDAARIDIIRDPANPGKALDAKAIEEGGRALGVQIVDRLVRGPDDIKKIFSERTSSQPGAFIVLVDGITLTNRTLLVDLVNQSRIPAIYQVRDFVDAGGLLSYGLDFCQHYARAASYADKILRGTRPEDLPVEFPTTFALVINLKTAKALNLTLPPMLLARADEVIE